MLVIRPIFALAPRTLLLDTHEFFEVLRAYLSTVKYAGVKTNI